MNTKNVDADTAEAAELLADQADGWGLLAGLS